MSHLITLYISDALGAYGFADPHPFGRDRMQAFLKQTHKLGLHNKVNMAAPNMCDVDDLRQFHTEAYIQKVKHLSVHGRGLLDAGDTPVFKGVYETTRTVVGAGLNGLSRMLSGESPRIFVPIAGLHHAQRDSAAGFCVFNDAGVLIECLQRQHGIRRIAYVDIDAHHGDGVFYAFEDNPDVIFADIHEDGKYLYPGTGHADEIGKGAAVGCKLNIPLPPGAQDDAFYAAWGKVEEFLLAAKPEIIILQAGADSIKGDPVTHMALTPKAHEHAAKRLLKLADTYCQGRIIGLGGGGYNRENLALGWNAVLNAFVKA